MWACVRNRLGPTDRRLPLCVQPSVVVLSSVAETWTASPTVAGLLAAVVAAVMVASAMVSVLVVAVVSTARSVRVFCGESLPCRWLIHLRQPQSIQVAAHRSQTQVDRGLSHQTAAGWAGVVAAVVMVSAVVLVAVSTTVVVVVVMAATVTAVEMAASMVVVVAVATAVTAVAAVAAIEVATN